MCTVLEAVFSRIVRDILLLDDIAAEETLQVESILYTMSPQGNACNCAINVSEVGLIHSTHIPSYKD